MAEYSSSIQKKLIRRESPPVLKSSVKDIPNHSTHNVEMLTLSHIHTPMSQAFEQKKNQFMTTESILFHCT